MSNWSDMAAVPRFKTPLETLVWAAEQYIGSATQGCSPPLTFGVATGRVLTPAYESQFLGVLDFLMFHSTVPVLGEPCAGAVSHPLAKAIGDAIAALMCGSLDRYCRALAPVLLAEDSLALGPTLQALADELGRSQATGLQQYARPAVIPFGRAHSRGFCH